MTEKQLQKKVCEYLTIKGIGWDHLPREIGRRRGQVGGWWDLCCIGYGHQFWIELKSPEKKRSEWDIPEKQYNFGIRLKANKIKHIMSNDYDEIIEFIDRIIN